MSHYEFDSDKQPASAVVGESRDAARYFTRIGYGEFKVLMFVLTFLDERRYVEFTSYAFEIFHVNGYGETGGRGL